MDLKKWGRISLSFLLLVGMGQAATVIAADPGAPGAAPSGKKPGWTALTFSYSRMVAKATVHVQIHSPALATDALLMKAGAGFSGSSETVNEMRLMVVDLRAEGLSFFEEQYTEKIWFNTADGRGYRRIRWRKEKDPWVKIYSWTEKGVLRTKIQPAGNTETEQDPVKWTKSTESFYPFPPNLMSGVVSDPILLLHLLSTREPHKLDSPFEIPVFGKEGFHRLTCRPETIVPVKVSFKTRSSSGVTAFNSTMKPLVYSIEARSLAPPNRKPEVFSLLGLQKDIRIHVDAAMRLPIRISGRNLKWGELVFELRDAQLD